MQGRYSNLCFDFDDIRPPVTSGSPLIELGLSMGELPATT